MLATLSQGRLVRHVRVASVVQCSVEPSVQIVGGRRRAKRTIHAHRPILAAVFVNRALDTQANPAICVSAFPLDELPLDELRDIVITKRLCVGIRTVSAPVHERLVSDDGPGNRGGWGNDFHWDLLPTVLVWRGNRQRLRMQHLSDLSLPRLMTFLDLCASRQCGSTVKALVI